MPTASAAWEKARGNERYTQIARGAAGCCNEVTASQKNGKNRHGSTRNATDKEGGIKNGGRHFNRWSWFLTAQSDCPRESTSINYELETKESGGSHGLPES
jgi:hypothetical protein